MLHYIDHAKMGRSRLGWLDSHFHFSFAEYWNPKNMNFGVLRVINDDMVQPQTGFDTHPHANMEIISYVVEGTLTHADSMKNKHELTRGQVQYMSAGRGVLHSEHNLGDKLLRFLQIWIMPDKKGYTPRYGDQTFKWEDRFDKWMPIATSEEAPANDAPIHLHQDMNVYATYLTKKGNTLDFEVKPGRQAYLVNIEGASKIKDIELGERDALEITEEDITIEAQADGTHMIILEMAKE
jgi:redox-sensitive bicupin YhaK (pirin superfamily)